MRKISNDIDLLAEYADEISSRLHHLCDVKDNMDFDFKLNYIHHLCKTLDSFCLTLYKEVYNEKKQKKNFNA